MAATNGDDSLTGTPGDDLIDALAGNDTVDGSSGNDTLYGGAGDDWLLGGAGNDLLDGGANGPFGDFASYGGEPSGVFASLALGTATGVSIGTDTLVAIENLHGSKTANDTLVGNGGNNWFRPHGGDDSVDGGGGTDAVMYEEATGPVNINLYLCVVTGGGMGTDSVVNVESAYGGAYGDTILLSGVSGSAFGRAGNDSISGGTGDDYFIGGSGNDTLTGGAGFDTASYDTDSFDLGDAPLTGIGVSVNLGTHTAIDNWGHTDTLSQVELVVGSVHADLLVGGDPANGSGATDGFEGFTGNGGNDTIDGGAGFDRAQYQTSTSAVNVTLGGTSNGSAQDGLGGTDTLIDIEEVRGSAHDDTLTGSDSGDFESFEGRAGNDTIDGKGGTDRINFQTSPAGVNVDLTAGSASDGWGGTDSFVNIENVRGSDSNDTVAGDAGPNDVDGRSGNDSLFGGAGSDYLRGGNGNDTLDGGANSNPGDTAARDAGFDGVHFGDATGPVTVTLGADGTAGTATGQGNDVLVDFELVAGSTFGDVISGTDRDMDEIFRGGAGNDTIAGGAGGTDLGFDMADYRFASGPVTVDIAAGTASGADGSDVLSGMEGVIASEYGDLVTGNAAGNYIEGRGGNDTIDGGSGNDRASYSNATGPVTVNLSSGTTTGAAGNDTLLSIEHARGSKYADTLIGSAGANDLQGRDGDDSVTGGAGNDTLHGGGGNDTLDGGDGIDTAQFSFDFEAYGIQLDPQDPARIIVTGPEGTDHLVDIEVLQFADRLLVVGDSGTPQDDVLEGTDADEIIRGRAGADHLRGSGGQDALYGDDGNDELDGGDGNDFLDGGTGNDTMAGGIGNDTYVVDSFDDIVLESDGIAAAPEGAAAQAGIGGGIDKVIASINYTLGSAVENLQLAAGTAPLEGQGNALANVMAGNDGRNTLIGGGGNDTIDGGAGIDTAAYSGTRGQYTVQQTGGGLQVSGGEGTDTLSNIERLWFTDTGVAYDLQGNAGTVAKILGVVFGRPSVANPQLAAIGLDIVDNWGLTQDQLMQLALDAALGPGASNQAVVTLLYTNLVGAAPTAEVRDSYVTWITSGSYTQVSLSQLAAEVMGIPAGALEGLAFAA
ncbi:MAG: hypothetical protein HY854_04290 [Burkholderiales bacterium]|nr:hypothetical protein [Burkholderiales bacterium]